MESVFVFTALSCEAKPLIRHWRLKKHPVKHPFEIYSDDERVVVVTGLGKVAMAGAVAYTLALFSGYSYPLLLNIGIAGHGWHGLGTLYLADKIVDAETGKKSYPQFPFTSECKTATVTTQASPATGYGEDCLYDMEASAFYEIASKFSTSELVHSLKIVSDNAKSPLEAISVNLVDGWISEHLETFDNIVERLGNGRQLLPDEEFDIYGQLLGQFHFTVSNAVKLKLLLQRWKLLMPDRLLNPNLVDAKNAKEWIGWLEKQLGATEFYL